MVFSAASNKGNQSGSNWTVATGIIDGDTPTRFEAFLASGQGSSHIVFHSPGGNLSAGLELGRMLRQTGMTAHVGNTNRRYATWDGQVDQCDTWADAVTSGICVSSCAYAFLGAENRLVNSGYYRSTSTHILGFHQFYDTTTSPSGLLTPDEVAGIQASTLSIAQAVTGQIVLYAVEMGVDPRIVAFAAATPSDELYYPTSSELEQLNIASINGLSSWVMEPYGSGLVTTSKPNRSDSLLQQVTAFCAGEQGSARFLITMRLATPSYLNPEDLPLYAVEIRIDGELYGVVRQDLIVRYSDNSILITVPVGVLRPVIINAQKIQFSLNAARSMGGFWEGSELSIVDRQSLSLAWRNCF
jgi:hypothetical protein